MLPCTTKQYKDNDDWRYGKHGCTSQLHFQIDCVLHVYYATEIEAGFCPNVTIIACDKITQCRVTAQLPQSHATIAQFYTSISHKNKLYFKVLQHKFVTTTQRNLQIERPPYWLLQNQTKLVSKLQRPKSDQNNIIINRSAVQSVMILAVQPR